MFYRLSLSALGRRLISHIVFSVIRSVLRVSSLLKRNIQQMPWQDSTDAHCVHLVAPRNRRKLHNKIDPAAPPIVQCLASLVEGSVQNGDCDGFGPSPSLSHPKHPKPISETLTDVSGNQCRTRRGPGFCRRYKDTRFGRASTILT